MPALIPNNKQQLNGKLTPYCIIYLTDSTSTVLDFQDYKKAIQHNWYRDTTNRVYTKVGEKTLFLSRFLLCPKEGEIVDHIDGDTLNNRRYNLRITDFKGNARNHGLNKNNTSGYKGVSLEQSKSSRWRAYITVNWKHITLGSYATKEEAAKAYNEAAVKYFGEFARLNEL